MGFFDKIKAAVGIGQPKMEASIDSTQLQRGSNITGKLTLTAQDREVPVKSFIVELQEVRVTREWSETTKQYENRKKYATIGKKEMAENNYVLKAKESVSRDFDIRIPGDAFGSGFLSGVI